MSDLIRSNISAHLSALGVTFSARLVGETVKDQGQGEKGWTCDEWRVSLVRDTRKMELPYFTGTGHRKQVLPMPSPAYRKGTLAYEAWEKTAFKPQAPHAADVLHSLTLDADAVNMSFVDWCGDYGYDSDSIRARGIYDACCQTGQELRRMFSREELEALREMLQDY